MMNELINNLISWVVLAQSAEAATQPSFMEVLNKMMPTFALVLFIFYFMVIRPQQQKLKTQESLQSALKKGDQVVTSSGIVGKVAGFEEDCVLLDIANNVKLKIERSNIAKLREYKEPAEKSAA